MTACAVLVERSMWELFHRRSWIMIDHEHCFEKTEAAPNSAVENKIIPRPARLELGNDYLAVGAPVGRSVSALPSSSYPPPRALIAVRACRRACPLPSSSSWSEPGHACHWYVGLKLTRLCQNSWETVEDSTHAKLESDTQVPHPSSTRVHIPQNPLDMCVNLRAIWI